MPSIKVLVVDDEPAVLGLVASMLALPGYDIHSTTNPLQALELVRAEPDFDLVVSDVLMPEMRGPELVGKIKEICPSIAVVMISGHLASESLPSGVGFISKPFLLSDLWSVVERTLARSAT